MRYLILIALMLSGCGQQNSQARVTVDPALAPYMQSFESDVGASTAGISAQFADTSVYANPLGETVGECTVWWGANGSVVKRLIQISPTYWNTMDQYGKTELFYHELGHCALYAVHINTNNGPSGCYTSIMYPIVFGETSCFQSNMSYYYQELSSHR